MCENCDRKPEYFYKDVWLCYEDFIKLTNYNAREAQ